MILHKTIDSISLRKKIKRGEIVYAGNRQLKIYGTLHCKSGKRMKKRNRIFFTDEQEALQYGFRPCGNCLKKAYRRWNQPNRMKNQSPAL